MNAHEKAMLVQQIRDMGLESGKVIKANGQWYIEGKPYDVPAPRFNVPHYTEGTKQVVIEHRSGNEG